MHLLHDAFPSRLSTRAAAATLVLLAACTSDRLPTQPAATNQGNVIAAKKKNPPPPPTTGVLLSGAGDIASCNNNNDEATAKLLDTIPGDVFTVGDNAYPDGTTQNFSQCYDPTWGRDRARTHPSPGNHDYHVTNAADYFSYFDSLAGPSGRGYYSYDLGSWHILSLDTEVDAAAGSPQEQWVRQDLADHPATCVMAYWHRSLFSSGAAHGNVDRMRDIWQALYDNGAEVVFSGHDHDYERFAPQTATGQADPQNGIREFVIGTGGASMSAGFAATQPNSEFRYDAEHGVMRLTLNDGSYSWQFINVSNQVVDSGSASCH